MSAPSNDVTKIGPVVCVDGNCYGEFSVRKLVRDLADAQGSLKTEREWVASLTKDNGILLQAADATKAGALAVSQAGRIEKLEAELAALREDKARLQKALAVFIPADAARKEAKP